MRVFFIAFYIWFGSLPPLRQCDIINQPIVGIEMSAMGFHRDLIYTVQFDYPLAGKDCEYILMQPLPAAVYISVDQFDDLQRLKKLNAIYPKFVDIEVPTENAEPITVLLKGTPKITDTIKIPIHFRYNAASDDDSAYAVVDISTPTMFMNCPEQDLMVNELEEMINIKYCLQEDQLKFVEFNEEHHGEYVENCNWVLIKADYQLKSELSAEIPIGNRKSYPLILYATIIISWIVSLYTVFGTHRVPRRINYKLEEQRILQNKIK